MKELFILGVNGSIGKQTLEVVAENADLIKVIGFSVSNYDMENFSLIEKYRPHYVIVREKINIDIYTSNYPDVEFFYSVTNLKKVLRKLRKSVVFINGLSGLAGVGPSLDIVNEGFQYLALANKESLVIAGKELKKAALRTGTKIIPVDSEISALFQLQNYLADKDEPIVKYGITASGGPLLDVPIADFRYVQPLQILNHPNWHMGMKITVDSATMLNKGFEVIEAAVYFDIPFDKIETVVERTSSVHAYVVTAQNTYYFVAEPDMKFFIAYALFYPEIDNSFSIVRDLTDYHFEKIDPKHFPLLVSTVVLYSTKPHRLKKLVEVSTKAVQKFVDEEIGYLNMIDEISKVF
jgi:1-deoxy-D-xylulose-5-phosphate reductoisomerase